MLVLDDVRPLLRDRDVGGTRVIDVRLDEREDSAGELAYFFTLVLPDAERWPVDDLLGLGDVLSDVLATMDLGRPWYVAFEPEHPGRDLDV